MKGKVLISRNYRGDIENNVIDKFIGLVMDREEDGTLTPLLTTEESTFAFIRRNNLYIVATTKKNSNIAMIFSLLHKICAVSIYESEFLTRYKIPAGQLVSRLSQIISLKFDKLMNMIIFG